VKLDSKRASGHSTSMSHLTRMARLEQCGVIHGGHYSELHLKSATETRGANPGCTYGVDQAEVEVAGRGWDELPARFS
jgi:hypothetical protein